MGLFRTLVCPKLADKEPDLDTARKIRHEKLPPYFSYLETTLGDATFIIGGALSVADTDARA